ncbi:MAG: tRNA lysidine(34) synthetase TilS [Candidatus Omnitrophica bacterium]|nr:tRNA lysidine(34) synthetase TilS [Candidatus Omnitrophota bacterium]
MIERFFLETIKKFNLLKKKDKLLLGISGGPDSIFLLHQLKNIQKQYSLKLVCVHFNHGLRKEADSEEDFVRQLCRELSIKFISEKKPVKEFFKGDSLEQTARNLRLDFFLKCSRQEKIKKIALAHHKDDLVETVLMRLIRGSGLKGLRGFLPRSRYKSLTIVRPLIEISKKNILSWLKQEKKSYCLDKSNFEDKFFRNKIRLKLLPALEDFNPNIVDSLFQLARTISEDYDFIYSHCRSIYLKLKKSDSKNTISLDHKGLKELTGALFNNVIRIAIEDLQQHTRRLEIRHLDEIRDLVLSRPTGSIVDLPNLIVKKSHNHIIIQSLLM